MAALPIERRDIILIGDEPLQAVRAQAIMEPWLFPAGRIVAVDINNPNEPLLVTVARDGATGQQETVALNRLQTVDVLVRFCLEYNVLLPRRGHKTAIIVTWPRDSGPHICLRLVTA